MMKDVKNVYNAAIIGCGWIGESKHVVGLMANPDIRLVALCDIDTEKAQRVNEQYQVGAKIYSDYKEMLKDETIDIVHVAVPNPLHCQLTCDALNAGKHVLCEKPMAMTKAECEQMIEAARKNDRKLTVGYQWRYRPETLYIKDYCDAGKLGDIYYAKAHGTRFRGVPAWGEYCTGNNGGGILIDGAPHSLDLALWAMNNYEPYSVKAYVGQNMTKHQEGGPWGTWPAEDFKVEDTGMALIRMKNGAVIYLEAAWAMNMLQDDMKATLVGTEAGIDMFNKGGVRICGVENGKPYVMEPDMSISPAPFAERPLDPIMRESVEFVKAIREDTVPFVDPAQAMVVTQIIEGIYESAKSGKEYFF